ncbi:hypothetical protein BGX29_000203 [Mortierella sp. GBA35]|nr:hypothetical protein BGX29_000203 [Mortierella sp. GBA35]
MVGHMYENGRGVPKNESVALEWYNKTIKDGDTDGFCSYAKGYLFPEVSAHQRFSRSHSNGISRQPFKVTVPPWSMGWLLKAADQGRPDAQYELGSMYYQGHDVDQDYFDALKWFIMTANHDHADKSAILLRPRCCQDYFDALKWLLEAAYQDHVSALRAVGLMYYDGTGVTQDYCNPKEWYLKVAAQGHASAQRELAKIYYSGLGVPRNHLTAFEWFFKTGKQDEAESQFRSSLIEAIPCSPLDDNHTDMEEDVPNVQALRSITKSSLNSSSNPKPATTAIAEVDIHTDPLTLKGFVLWEDILLAFEDALHVRHKARVVPFLKGSDLRSLEPRRIAAFPDTVLNVVVPDPPVPVKVAVASPLSALQQFEKQASRLPKHDPMATLRSPTRILDPQSSNRRPLETPSAQMRNRQLALKTAKAAIGKIAAHVDLIGLHMKGDGAPDDFFKALGCYLSAYPRDLTVATPVMLLNVARGDNLVRMSSAPKTTLEDMDSSDSSKTDPAQIDQPSDSNKSTEIRLLQAKKQPPILRHNSVDPQLKDETLTESPPTSDNKQPQSPQDPTTAATAKDITQIMASASRGDKDAQVTLGDMFLQGEEVRQSYLTALDWYLKAADRGYAPAQNKIGDIYRLGQGFPQDLSRAMDYYRKAATHRDAVGQYNYAQMYLFGLGVHLDFSYALYWYEKAADQGYAPAQSRIGDMHANGQCVSQDSSEALEWYRAAAEQDLAEAQFRIGYMYDHGHGVPEDESVALEWYNKAIKHGDVDGWGSYTKGYLYCWGLGVAQDLSIAFEWYLQAAQQGHVSAQGEVGLMFYKGEGVTRDYRSAMDWHLKAASQGRAESQHHLGAIYYSGEGVPQDHSIAFEWFFKAALQGHAYAQHKVGTMYHHGQGVGQDYTQAMTWFLKAAAQCVPPAEHQVGTGYYRGQGISCDYSVALQWFSRAAHHEYPTAQFDVGIMYRDGQGVIQYDSSAMEWLLKAANQGHVQAQFEVGAMYSDGKGVPQDLPRAKEWYSKAAAQGHEESQSCLFELQKEV